MKTVRKSRFAGRPYRYSLSLLLAGLTLCLAASSCKTYVGSIDLHDERWSSPIIIKRESDFEQKLGLILTCRGNIIELQFAERSLEMRTEKVSKEEQTGRMYYFYDPDIISRIGYVVLLPLTGLVELFSWSWESKGTHSPGIFYQIAYLPFIKLLFQPILCSPSSILVRDTECHFETETVWNEWETTMIKMQDIYTPVFETDRSQATVTISSGNTKKEKKLSFDGKVSFSVSDFYPGRLDPDRRGSFQVYHPKWKMTWIVETPATLDPEVIRDWNIFVDEQYDYRNRVLALSRLKPVLGETACRDYFNRLLDGKVDKTTLPPMPTEIRVVPQQ